MPQGNNSNVYENETGQLGAEAERLRTFDIPTRASIEAIGVLQPGSIVLDIGAGENLGFNAYASAQGAKYIAFDIRHSPLLEQARTEAFAAKGNARSLPFAENSVDVAHARFVLAHINHGRQQIVTDTLRCVKLGGKAVFIDYDWTVLEGSGTIIQLRDFTLANIKVFDAAFGANSILELSTYTKGIAKIQELRTRSPQLFDYGPVLGLRQVTVMGLRMQGASEDLVKQANSIFDSLEAEAASKNVPGFRMPDMVAVVASKL